MRVPFREVSPHTACEPLGDEIEREVARGGRKSTDQRAHRAAHYPGRAFEQPRDAVSVVRRVPVEELIASLARQCDHDTSARRTREEIGGQDRRITERFVHDVGQARKQLKGRIDGETFLVMLGSQMSRDHPRVRPLVERLLVEGNRERSQRFVHHLGHHGSNVAGVNASAEENPEGHVADQMASYDVT